MHCWVPSPAIGGHSGFWGSGLDPLVCLQNNSGFSVFSKQYSANDSGPTACLAQIPLPNPTIETTTPAHSNSAWIALLHRARRRLSYPMHKSTDLG